MTRSVDSTVVRWLGLSAEGQINTAVWALAIDPETTGTFYAVGEVGGGVFSSTDGATTWAAISSGPTESKVFALVIDPTASRTLYAGTYAGVWRSRDGGGTWSMLNTGLTDTDVVALAVDTVVPGRLYAGTRSGVFAIRQIEACTGDCAVDGAVSVEELITLVRVALGMMSVVECGSGDANGDGVITIDEIIEAVNVLLRGCPINPAEQGCLDSGGSVASAMCCAGSGEFPDTCAVGACGCSPEASQAVPVCRCGAGTCFDGFRCMPL